MKGNIFLRKHATLFSLSLSCTWLLKHDHWIIILIDYKLFLFLNLLEWDLLLQEQTVKNSTNSLISIL